MKNILSLFALMSLLLTGCARHYVITLNNGHRITTQGKPQLQDNYYIYTDAAGQPGSISTGRVREIAPASMARSRFSSGYEAGPSK